MESATTKHVQRLLNKAKNPVPSETILTLHPLNSTRSA